MSTTGMTTIHSLLDTVADNLGKTMETKKKKLSSLLNVIADVVMVGIIVPASKELLEMLRAGNRIVSFVLDDTTHLGTGILIGPSHVLTAAHLFFQSSGELVDAGRMKRLKVEVDTTNIGSTLIRGPRRTITLGGLIDPPVSGTAAQRPVQDLDFAIVRLAEAIGAESVGSEMRGWFSIPAANDAPVLAVELPIRILQYIDDGELRESSGFIRQLTSTTRVAHTASTVDGSSGAPLLDDAGTLLAIHVSGAISGVVPKSNYALPIAQIASSIDTPGVNGITIRQLLKS